MYVDICTGGFREACICANVHLIWVSGWKGMCMLLYFCAYLGECVYTYLRIRGSAQWLYRGLCASVSVPVFTATGMCGCVSGFLRPGTSTRSAWTAVLKGLRETGAAITLNHSFASLASAPVEKCFKKQNK